MNATPLTAEDAVLLYAEAPGTQLQIGALCFFDAAPLRDRRGRLRIGTLRSHVESRLCELPRFRQRILPVLGDLAAPVWVDDSDFDITRHVTLIHLPPPGGDVALGGLIDRLLAEPMDPGHPLWSFHLVDGLGDGKVTGHPGSDTAAIILRAHHVMADGLALHAAAMLLLDTVPRPPTARRRHWVPEPTPTPLALATGALVERSRRQVGLVLEAAGAVLDPRRTRSTLRSTAQVLGSARHGLPAMAPASPFTAPTGTRRGFAWATVPMEDVVAVKHACGTTVNDVVLAIVAGAVRRAMEADGSFDRTARAPRALVPVGSNLSTASLGNRFSVTGAPLPVAVDDPLERVRLIHAHMHGATPSTVQGLLPHVFSIADVVAPGLLRAVIPRVLAHQPLVNLAVSNIPGSRAPLYLWESRLLGLHPFIDVVGNVALIIGVLSYGDTLGVGITVDPDITGDPRSLATHVCSAAAELAGLARASGEAG